MSKKIILALLFWAAAATADENDQRFLSSKIKAEVFAGQLVDGGEFDRAETFLNRAVIMYPRSDHLLTLYGQTLYESRRIIEAESQFMEAIRKNPLNKVAKAYIEVIRETSEASISVEANLIKEVMWDKVGDIVVFALGFFVGSIMSGTFKRYAAWRFTRKCRRTFLKGDFDDYADLLEIQLTTNELAPLRDSLNFLLDNRTLDESLNLLANYVNTEENLNTLTRMLTLAHEKNSTNTAS